MLSAIIVSGPFTESVVRTWQGRRQPLYIRGEREWESGRTAAGGDAVSSLRLCEEQFHREFLHLAGEFLQQSSLLCPLKSTTCDWRLVNGHCLACSLLATAVVLLAAVDACAPLLLYDSAMADNPEKVNAAAPLANYTAKTYSTQWIQTHRHTYIHTSVLLSRTSNFPVTRGCEVHRSSSSKLVSRNSGCR